MLVSRLGDLSPTLEPTTESPGDLGCSGRLHVRCPSVLLLMLTLVGCFNLPSIEEAGAPSSLDTVTGAELREASATNVFDALVDLRPHWLRARIRAGSLMFQEAAEPVVYIYNLRHGPVSTLHAIHTEGVRRVQFIDPLDATTRYGAGHSGGVILLDMVRSKDPLEPVDRPY